MVKKVRNISLSLTYSEPEKLIKFVKKPNINLPFLYLIYLSSNYMNVCVLINIIALNVLRLIPASVGHFLFKFIYNKY